MKPVNVPSDSASASGAPVQPAPCSLSGFFARERARARELWQEVASQVKLCALSHETFHTAELSTLEALKRNIGKFVQTVRLRMEAEEQLFALMDEVTWRPRGYGLTAKLRSEHRRIEQLLEMLDRTSGDRTCAATIESVAGRLAELPNILVEHGDIERTLFLRADHVLAAAEVRTLLDGMQKRILRAV